LFTPPSGPQAIQAEAPIRAQKRLRNLNLGVLGSGERGEFTYPAQPNPWVASAMGC